MNELKGRGRSVGVDAVERMARADTRAIVLRALMDVAMGGRTRPVTLTPEERSLRAALVDEGASAAEASRRFRLAPERLAFMCVRILHAPTD